MKSIFWCALLTIAMLARQSTAVADDQSHRKAAEDLLNAMNVQKAMEAATDQMIEVQIKANPQLAPMRDVLKQWVSKFLSYESIKDELITVYCGELTEDELKQIAAFYNTPAGKRWTEEMPKINAKTSQLGSAQAQAHQAELQKMIQEEQAKLGAPAK